MGVTEKMRLEIIIPKVLMNVLNDVDRQMVVLHVQLIQFSMKIVIFTLEDRTRTEVVDLM